MPRDITLLRVFVASPSDIKEEKRLLDDVIAELNLVWPDQLGVMLELVRWETHVIPSISTDPQAAINEQIKDNYDIFIGILWTRFGTATPRAESGTEEEFDRAYKRWQASPETVRVMIYFNTLPVSPDDIDIEQLAKVKSFRDSLNDKGLLYSTYSGVDEFASRLRIHLSQQVREWKKSWGFEDLSKSAKSATATSQSKVYIPTVNGDVPEDEGIIELMERAEAESRKFVEIMTALTGGLQEMSSGIERVTIEQKEYRESGSLDLATQKRFSNQAADILSGFANKMRSGMPALSANLYSFVNAYGKALAIAPEFSSSDKNIAALAQALANLEGLESAMNSSQTSVRGMRESAARLPRLTTQFNRARREILEVLDTYLATVDKARDLVSEIIANTKTSLPPSDQVSS
ncbi:MAG: DUF4062 domain-containing protein [Anaerolineales bacterium]